MSGDPTIKGDEDEVMEPDELGTRMVEKRQIVSIASPPLLGTVLILEAILYCR
jgi:hypothetical protein